MHFPVQGVIPARLSCQHHPTGVFQQSLGMGQSWDSESIQADPAQLGAHCSYDPPSELDPLALPFTLPVFPKENQSQSIACFFGVPFFMATPQLSRSLMMGKTQVWSVGAGAWR